MGREEAGGGAAGGTSPPACDPEPSRGRSRRLSSAIGRPLLCSFFPPESGRNPQGRGWTAVPERARRLPRPDRARLSARRRCARGCVCLAVRCARRQTALAADLDAVPTQRRPARTGSSERGPHGAGTRSPETGPAACERPPPILCSPHWRAFANRPTQEGLLHPRGASHGPPWDFSVPSRRQGTASAHAVGPGGRPVDEKAPAVDVLAAGGVLSPACDPILPLKFAEVAGCHRAAAPGWPGWRGG